MEEPLPTSARQWDLVYHEGKYGIGFWDRDFKRFTPVMIFHDVYNVRRLVKHLELKLTLLEKQEEQIIASEVEEFLEKRKPPAEDP